MCLKLCTIVVHNTALNSSDDLPYYPPDNHHSSDGVYRRGGDSCDTYQERLGDFRCGFNRKWHGGNGQMGPDTTNSLVTDQIDQSLSGVRCLDCRQDVQQDLTKHTQTKTNIQPHTGKYLETFQLIRISKAAKSKFIGLLIRYHRKSYCTLHTLT